MTSDLPPSPSQVLVTGGTGFIGRRLVRRLLDGGHRVRILARPESSASNYFGNEVDVRLGDIRRREDILSACEGVDTVYHLAAATSGPLEYHLDATVNGTKILLGAAREAGVRHLVYTSTFGVYAASRFRDGVTIDEDFPLESHPERRGSYSRAKRAAEDLVLEYLASPKEMTLTVLRPGLVYGPGKLFFPDLGIRVHSRILILMGFGGRRLPLLHVENLVDAYLLAGTRPSNAAGKIYNVVDGELPSQQEYLRLYRAATGDPLHVIPVPFTIFRLAFWVADGLASILLRKKLHLSYRLSCLSGSPRYSAERIMRDLEWRQSVAFTDALPSGGVRR